MHKDWMVWLIAVILFGAGCVAGVLAGSGVKVSLDPAWVQAIGSVAAILIAIVVAYSQRAWDRKRDSLAFYRTHLASLYHCKKSLVQAGRTLEEIGDSIAGDDRGRGQRKFFCAVLDRVSEALDKSCATLEDTDAWAQCDTLQYALREISTLVSDETQREEHIREHIEAALDTQLLALGRIGHLQEEAYRKGVRYL
ncbi:hypothetical protein ACS8E9_09540 [Pseudomonas neustonica]|uniref:hypothetical protein n=1 Tax=Pseudomonas neustonica TaxID=2487346 RepID=UPI003F45F4C8